MRAGYGYDKTLRNLPITPMNSSYSPLKEFPNKGIQFRMRNMGMRGREGSRIGTPTFSAKIFMAAKNRGFGDKKGIVRVLSLWAGPSKQG